MGLDYEETCVLIYKLKMEVKKMKNIWEKVHIVIMCLLLGTSAFSIVYDIISNVSLSGVKLLIPVLDGMIVITVVISFLVLYLEKRGK